MAGALDYYASRGETPMAWGGAGAAWLGLEGEVDLDEWRAVFGTGGAHHPVSGERLVGCMRPGMEIVVSPHKTVAELGVIGRAEDMHQIVDAERDATMAYLDEVVRDQGGRRGRAQVRTPTGGPHLGGVPPCDHPEPATPRSTTTSWSRIFVRMGDERGGWKGLDTGLLRDHLHAATAVGRMAAAAKAVELGYGIEADPGPSGRLGGWAISGIPKEAWEVHATRSAQIDAAVGPDASYRSRSVAARATRDRKAPRAGRGPGAPLAGRAGPGRLPAARAGRRGRAWPASPTSRPAWTCSSDVADELLAPGGRLASEKTFTRDDVVVAVAPHAARPACLGTWTGRSTAVLSHEHAVALPLVAGAREPVWAAACVVEDEQRIATLAERP